MQNGNKNFLYNGYDKSVRIKIIIIPLKDFMYFLTKEHPLNKQYVFDHPLHFLFNIFANLLFCDLCKKGKLR